MTDWSLSTQCTTSSRNIYTYGHKKNIHHYILWSLPTHFLKGKQIAYKRNHFRCETQSTTYHLSQILTRIFGISYLCSISFLVPLTCQLRTKLHMNHQSYMLHSFCQAKTFKMYDDVSCMDQLFPNQTIKFILNFKHMTIFLGYY